MSPMFMSPMFMSPMFMPARGATKELRLLCFALASSEKALQRLL